MRRRTVLARLRSAAVVIGATALIAGIIYLDITTGIWNDLVILAGLAAGLVSFLLTALVLDRIMARSRARRWAPVNRLALSEFLHAIADEQHSEISRGRIVARALPLITAEPGTIELRRALDGLRQQLMSERERLTELLSRWAEFLASSGDNEQILRHLSEIAWQLDLVRDAALEAESTVDTAALGELNAQIASANEAVRALESELRHRLEQDARQRLAD